MDLLRASSLFAIRCYQRFVSPYKGFGCAYRVHTGRCSCSQLGYRAIRRFGLGKGWWVLRERTWLCGVVHRRHAPAVRRPPARERGDCDCDLPCDLGDLSGHGRTGLCDVLSCCDVTSCDWPGCKGRREDERAIHIPPYADLGQGKPSRHR